MARAGFYAVQAAKIRFGRDGLWYADDEPITNPRIAALFTRHLQRESDGSYVIRMGDEQAPVEVEDTPFVIVALTVNAEGALVVEVNDGTTEVLDSAALAVGDDDVLYCRVKGGREKARVLRPAYYQLAPYISEQAGVFVVRVGDATHSIQKTGRRD